jgi:tetratricopeptide (TPR) repeat protein
MKTEIKEILDYMEQGEEILHLRDQVKELTAQDVAALQGFIERVIDLADKSAAQDQDEGFYDLFLGCAYHEQADYKQAINHLKQALKKLSGSKNNKAVAHWLLSINYSSSKDFDKARKELVKAEKLSQARIVAMQQKVDMKVKAMFNDPIFELVPPDPTPKAARVVPPPAPAVNADAPALENAVTPPQS